MYERKIPLGLDCGLDLLREVVGGKWKISLLYFISQGLQRPSQLHKRLPSATRRVLNLQLSQMVEHELVCKHVVTQRPLKVEYQLTPLGESLLPLVVALGAWGDTHQERLRQVVLHALNLGPEPVQ